MILVKGIEPPQNKTLPNVQIGERTLENKLPSIADSKKYKETNQGVSYLPFEDHVDDLLRQVVDRLFLLVIGDDLEWEPFYSRVISFFKVTSLARKLCLHERLTRRLLHRALLIAEAWLDEYV